MSEHRLAYPLALALPGGVVADYVAGSDPPRYTVDGAPIALDVAIPADLAALGWHWNGSLLSWRDDDPQGQLMISTDLHPPPGWPSERRDCFTVARTFDLTTPARVEAARPVQTKRIQTQDIASPPAEPVQLTLFEEVAHV